ncbi:hypothetical protein [Psychromonas sp. KJ10-2]|uniref:hypothetical protein n=1 Tax=Psychromonas sp. KJ10-2 TaxID=3391822 RepID=UPI0039B4B2D0
MKKIFVLAAVLLVSSQSNATDYADLAKDKSSALLNGKSLKVEEKSHLFIQFLIITSTEL